MTTWSARICVDGFSSGSVTISLIVSSALAPISSDAVLIMNVCRNASVWMSWICDKNVLIFAHDSHRHRFRYVFSISVAM